MDEVGRRRAAPSLVTLTLGSRARRVPVALGLAAVLAVSAGPAVAEPEAAANASNAEPLPAFRN